MMDNLAATLVALDFDGTLSRVVDDPADAAIDPAAAEMVAAVASSVGRCIVVSGRPVSFLREQVPVGIDVVGLYGLEGVSGGELWRHENCGVWREAVADVAARAAAHGPEGMRVESKELTITLHYREHPELEEAVLALAASEAKASGLCTRAAKMSIELNPPIPVDKGTIMAAELKSSTYARAVFIGDDVGDLPAMRELALFGERSPNHEAIRVVASSAETPAELLELADIVVDGVPGVVDFLGQFTEPS